MPNFIKQLLVGTNHGTKIYYKWVGPRKNLNKDGDGGNYDGIQRHTLAG